MLEDADGRGRARGEDHLILVRIRIHVAQNGCTGEPDLLHGERRGSVVRMRISEQIALQEVRRRSDQEVRGKRPTGPVCVDVTNGEPLGELVPSKVLKSIAHVSVSCQRF